jgi:hypothetical protein
MNDDRTLERTARSWLEEGPAEAPDRAVDAALSRIQTIGQERELRLPWRDAFMTRYLLPVAAALIVVIGVAAYLATRTSSSVGPAPTPTPIPTATPAPTAAPTPPATPGPTPNDTACKLLTAAEVNASGSVDTDPAPRARTTTATSDCTYQTGGGVGDIVAEVELTKPGGAAAFNAAKALAGVQTIKDLGTDAVYDPAWEKLYVLKGDTLVTIMAGNFQETAASQLEQVMTLARLVIPRL